MGIALAAFRRFRIAAGVLGADGVGHFTHARSSNIHHSRLLTRMSGNLLGLHRGQSMSGRLRAGSGSGNDAVDDWIYSEVANTFVFDESMLDRLRELNPHSAHSLVRRLLEANGRGYWDVEQAVLDRLKEISRSLEDQLEGVA